MRDAGLSRTSGARPDSGVRAIAGAGVDSPRPVAVLLMRISSGAGYSAKAPRTFSRAEQRASRAKLIGLFAVMAALWIGIQLLNLIAG